LLAMMFRLSFLASALVSADHSSAALPRTRSRQSLGTQKSAQLAKGAVLDWIADDLDAPGARSCLRAIATNGTDRWIVGEGGIVLTGAFGKAFTTVLDTGFPNYFYGAIAHGPELLITGFTDPPFPQPSLGIARSTFDGGLTWEEPIIVSNGTWVGGPIAATDSGRVVVPSTSDGSVFVREAGSWQTVAAGDAWHSGPFVVDGDDAWLAGVYLCHSNDSAHSFSCGDPVDYIFDGGIAVLDDAKKQWLTAGGSISPTLNGWVHSSQDGRATWGERATFSYPIRHVGAACGKAIAVGGDFSSGVGGIWTSIDGGRHWTLDLDTGVEMSSCAAGDGFATCVGSANGKPSVVVTVICKGIGIVV